MRNDDIPAFPVSVDRPLVVYRYSGMSLRDYFAAAALPFTLPLAADIVEHVSSARTHAARLAYDIADAMLAERDKS